MNATIARTPLVTYAPIIFRAPSLFVKAVRDFRRLGEECDLDKDGMRLGLAWCWLARICCVRFAG